MNRTRVNYFDVIAKAGIRAGSAIADEIVALSASYRSGSDSFHFDRPERRAAYLWHHFPAHVMDAAQVLANLPEVLASHEVVRLAALGSGPGSEVFGLLEALSVGRARGRYADLREVHAVRLDRAPAWEQEFPTVLAAAMPQYAFRCKDLGTAWTIHADRPCIAFDLADTRPTPRRVAEALAEANLVTMVNLLSELAPRGTARLPAPVAERMQRLFADDLAAEVDLVLIDRSGAPGAKGRIDHVLEIAAAERTIEHARGPKDRETRCGCAITRRVKQLYQHVKLPTTNDQDRPVLNCKTTWAWARLTR